MQCFDIAIIGCGLVGASFARSVAVVGLNVLVVDKLPPQALYSDSLDNRGLALSHTTKQILDSLNCWHKIAPNAYAIENVHVSEQYSFGHAMLNAAANNIPALGYVVSASNLGKAITQDLEQLKNITIMRPAEVNNMVFDNHSKNWQLSINNQDVRVKLLVAADGANSVLRNTKNIVSNTIDYEQLAIVTNVKIAAKNITTAYERFSANGVIALLPFGPQNIKCVWTAPNVIAAQLKAMSDIEFIAALQAVIGFRLGKFNTISERKSFAIVQTCADPIYSEGLVLIGNAANTLHPVAAQGFNLGIRDAVTLAKVLGIAKNNNQEINSIATLQQYAALRFNDHNKTLKFTNSLVDIFADNNNIVKASRRLGILAAQFIRPLNKKIISHGLGTWT